MPKKEYMQLQACIVILKGFQIKIPETYTMNCFWSNVPFKDQPIICLILLMLYFGHLLYTINSGTY